MTAMHGEIQGEVLSVTLTTGNCLRVLTYGVVAERISPVFDDADIVVRTLESRSDYEANWHIDSQIAARVAIAEVFRNEDLCIYVPGDWLKSTDPAPLAIPSEHIISRTTPTAYLENFKFHLPSLGIEVHLESLA